MARISYRIAKNRKAVFCTVRGALEEDEMLEFSRTLLDDTDIPVGSVALVDFREVDLENVSSEGVHKVAHMFRNDVRNTRLAFVAPDELAYGLSRMYEAIRQDSAIEIQVFRDLDQAREWLGLT